MEFEATQTIFSLGAQNEKLRQHNEKLVEALATVLSHLLLLGGDIQILEDIQKILKDGKGAG